MKKVLISAPYMVREKEKVEKMFIDYNYEFELANVIERLEEEEILKIISKYHGIICGDDRLTPRVLDKASNLEVIVKWGTGIDAIDKKYAEKKGIPVYNTPNAFTEPVSETTIAFMLSFVRNIIENDQILKCGGWDKPQAATIAEKNIGIIGYGNIGQRVSEKLFPFRANIFVNDIKEIDKEILLKNGCKFVDKEFIYRNCDIITLHCDLNSTSNNLINKKVFSIVKDNLCLINTARGPIINETDLIDWLKEKKSSRVGLDVFEKEPLAQNSYLRTCKRAILSAHNSNSSIYAWGKVHKNSLELLKKGLSKNDK